MSILTVVTSIVAIELLVELATTAAILTLTPTVIPPTVVVAIVILTIVILTIAVVTIALAVTVGMYQVQEVIMILTISTIQMKGKLAAVQRVVVSNVYFTHYIDIEFISFLYHIA
jgi:hypothetical protein